jgi:hypothetical protein
MLASLAVLAVLAWARPAQAYAWMIRHDYTGCAQCHADPSGGSLLTAYGRAQGELLLRTQYGPPPDDPTKVASFLWGLFETPDWLLLGGDLRTLTLHQTTPGAPALNDTFLMQADLTGQVTVGRVRANGSLGYAQKGALKAAITHNPQDNLVSRAHWIGVDIGEDRNWLLRAGRMNLPFGIRSIEHTLWVRARTRTDINDGQQHGVALAYNGGNLRGEVMGIAGNFQVNPDASRERGFSGYVEWDPTGNIAAGASSLVTYADRDIDLQTQLLRHAHGLFARWSPFGALVVLSEADMLVQSQPATRTHAAETLLGFAGMLQADYEPLQGVHLVATGELLDATLSRTGASYGGWATLQWFVAPHMDLRADAIWQSLASTGASVSSTTLLAQLHLFL